MENEGRGGRRGEGGGRRRKLGKKKGVKKKKVLCAQSPRRSKKGGGRQGVGGEVRWWKGEKHLFISLGKSTNARIFLGYGLF